MEYFEGIGEQINSIRLYAESTPCYGFAKFRRSSSAQRVLGRQNCIRGSMLTVFEHPYGSDSYEEAHGTPVLWLNDDCLEKVFGFLSEEDLCSVADTCKRFKYSAQSEFQLHRSHITFENHFGPENSFPNTTIMLPNMLRNFGAFMKAIWIYKPVHFDRLVEMIARYCGPALTSLRLIEVPLAQYDDTIKFLRLIFSRLQFLEISDCVSSFNSVLPSCSMLQELKMMYWTGIDFLDQIRFIISIK